MILTLGFSTLGNGPETILVLHDWFSDQTSYDSIRPYLNTGLYKFVFIDLRGYGKSKSIYGACTLEEAAKDIVTIADNLGVDKFHLVGHSMGGQIVQYIPIEAPGRVKSIAAICPVPACGTPIPDDVLEHLTTVAKGDMAHGKAIVDFMTQNRYHNWFSERKTLHWFSCSTPQARIAYLRMFCETDISALVKGIDIPTLVVCGDYDAAAYSFQRIEQTILKDFKNTQTVCLPSGHYPMEECPIILAATLDRFWGNINLRN